jgi:hypothetical protein
MVEITQRLCNPQQARELFEKGVKQTTQYAWEWNGTDYNLAFASDEITGLPKLVDWTNDTDTYAAFDTTDLGMLLSGIEGCYPAGPTYRIDPQENEHFRWWCDDIATFTQIEDTIYQAYGRTEAEAKAGMLIRLLDKGLVPITWPYYGVQHLQKLQAFNNTYYIKPNQDNNEEPF